LTLQGRTAIVNGANGIVGSAIVRAFLENGMNVITWHGRPDKAQAMIDRYADYKDQFFAIGGGDTKEALEGICERFGGIDVVVAAQGFPPINQDFADIEKDYWNDVVRTNLYGSVPIIQNAIPFLQKSRAPRVIFLTSAEGKAGGFYDGLAYSAAKGGVIALTYGLAKRLAKDQITVNAVALGGIYNMEPAMPDEPKKDNIPDYADTDLVTKIPLGRLGRAEDVSAAVCYLASEEAGFVTGEILNVSGGLTMG